MEFLILYAVTTIFSLILFAIVIVDTSKGNQFPKPTRRDYILPFIAAFAFPLNVFTAMMFLLHLLCKKG